MKTLDSTLPSRMCILKCSPLLSFPETTEAEKTQCPANTLSIFGLQIEDLGVSHPPAPSRH